MIVTKRWAVGVMAAKLTVTQRVKQHCDSRRKTRMRWNHSWGCRSPRAASRNNVRVKVSLELEIMIKIR